MLRRGISTSHIRTLNRLVDGHPGAATALIDLLRCGRSIETPVSDDAAWCLEKLEVLGIRGVALDILWGDVCGCDANQMMRVLRACGDVSEHATSDTVMRAINH